MTEIYDWNSIPDCVDIKCPECGKLTEFQHSAIVKIALKKDVLFFQESSLFDYELRTDSSGSRWHAAVYNPKLHGGTTNSIRSLPDGYYSEKWKNKYSSSSYEGKRAGAYSCSYCNNSRKHNLDWPIDAFYSIEYKSQQLWAYNRESLVDLRDFIESDERTARNFKWRFFLMHIPTIFKKEKAREAVVKKLNKLLLG